VPVGEIARKATGTDKAKNTVVMGLLSGWFGVVREGMMSGLRKKLFSKGPAVLEANERAFQQGIEYAASHPLRTPRTMARPTSSGAKLLTDGNSICAAAAIFAGCDFFGGYPITPSTEVMQLLTREIWKYGGAVLQAETDRRNRCGDRPPTARR
jgi:2-oxoglutarate ferredoxin oxidoreductase subunit alpha